MHPDVADVAVVGVEDADLGQRIAAVITLAAPSAEHGTPDMPALSNMTTVAPSRLTLRTLRAWTVAKAAPYKAPSELWVVKTIPRNAMGKVNKKTLIATLQAEGCIQERCV